MKLLLILAALATILITSCGKTVDPSTNVDIVNTYKQEVPASRFIGKVYTPDDMVDGSYAKCWEVWFANQWFLPLEALLTDNFTDQYQDGGAYIGLERTNREENSWEYLIGMFLPEGTEPPEGYIYYDFPPMELGVNWIKGIEPYIYGTEQLAYFKLIEMGMNPLLEIDGIQWTFERYTDGRFTTPDEEGKIILDMCFFIE